MQTKELKQDNETKYATAYINSIKSSPIKIIKLTNSLVGMSVAEALKITKFCNLKIAYNVNLLLHSAMSNAENNDSMDIDNLYVEKFDVGKAFCLKRFAIRARGRSSRILKTFSNIRVYLVEKE